MIVRSVRSAPSDRAVTTTLNNHHRRKRLRLCVHAVYTDISVPQSRDEMVKQAGVTLSQRLSRDMPKQKKRGFKKSAGAGLKVALELAAVDNSPQNVTSLVRDVLQHLEPSQQLQCIVAFHDIQAALLASDVMENEIGSLQDFEPSSTSGVLVVVGVPPASPQEEEAAQLVRNWKGAAAVWLSLGMNSFSDKLTSTRASLETVFAFEPVAAKGLIRTTEGLIYKATLDGKPSPWLLYKRSWGQYKLIGKTSQRPTASDLELALYNSSASESPIVKGIKAFKTATSKQK